MNEANEESAQPSIVAPIESPPIAPRVEASTPDPRADLLRLANELTKSRSARLLVEYLRLRRAMQ